MEEYFELDHAEFVPVANLSILLAHAHASLRFRPHLVVMTTNVNKIYRAIELALSNRDLHRFVWKKNPDTPLMDSRAKFGIFALSFAANMAVNEMPMT